MFIGFIMLTSIISLAQQTTPPWCRRVGYLYEVTDDVDPFIETLVSRHNDYAKQADYVKTLEFQDLSYTQIQISLLQSHQEQLRLLMQAREVLDKGLVTTAAAEALLQGITPARNPEQ